MSFRFKDVWIELRSSLWFMPTMVVLGSVALAVLMIQIDTNIRYETLAKWPRIFGSSPAGARGLLSTVAGSMITVAGVTFSITIVALSLASNQYTSRILRNFMSDRANQMVLGIFLGIFTYCLIVLRTIRGGEQEFVPSLGALVGIVLAIVGIGYLIFFIHHIATAIQVNTITAAICTETLRSIERVFPDELGVEPEEDEERVVEQKEPWLADAEWTPVPARTTGYLQHVDADGIIRLAKRCDIVLRMETGVGEFVVRDAPLVSVTSKQGGSHRRLEEEEMKELADCFTINLYRTIDQDAGFGIRQLVDIALKALSPGINETTTAITCVDYLGAIIFALTKRRIPSQLRYDGRELRVIARGPTFRSLLDEALHQIRQNAQGNTAVILRMLDAIERAASALQSPARRRALWLHVELLMELARNTIQFEHDRRVLDERFVRVARTLGKHYARETMLSSEVERQNFTA